MFKTMTIRRSPPEENEDIDILDAFTNTPWDHRNDGNITDDFMLELESTTGP